MGPGVFLQQDDDDDDIGMTPWTDRATDQKLASVKLRQTAIDITAEDLGPRLTPSNVADLVLISMVSSIFLFYTYHLFFKSAEKYQLVDTTMASLPTVLDKSVGSTGQKVLLYSSKCLSLSQTTNFRLFQTQTAYRRQFQM